MTRKEEIVKEAEDSTFALEGDIGTAPHSRETITEYFIEMAEWADEHPRKGLVDIERVKDFLSSVDLNFYREWEDKFNTDELIVDLERYLEK